jgi:hypothetical protein
MHTIQAKLGAQLAKACCRYITYQETKQHLETPRDTSTPHTSHLTRELVRSTQAKTTAKRKKPNLLSWRYGATSYRYEHPTHILSVWTSNAHPTGMNTLLVSDSLMTTTYRYTLTHDNNKEKANDKQMHTSRCMQARRVQCAVCKQCKSLCTQ